MLFIDNKRPAFSLVALAVFGATAVILLTGRRVEGQWKKPDPSNAYYNGEKVVIGTSHRGNKIDVSGSGFFTDFSDTINSTVTSGTIFSNSTTTTNGGFFHLGTTATDAYWGAASSTGGNPFSSSEVANSALYFGNKDNVALQLLTAAAVRMTITGVGNVGIGTSSPLGKFVVSSTNGAGAGTGDLVIQNPTAFTHGDTRTSAISFKTNNGNNLLNYESVSIRAAMTPSNGVTSPQANLQFWTASNTEGLAERLRITETGNVGVGAASPLGKFVVSSTNGAGAGTGDLVIQNPTAFGNGPRTSAISFKTNNGDNLLNYESVSIRAIMTPSNGVTSPQANLQFWTASNTEGLAERVRITEAGNVGIGTTSPGQKLSVNGDALLGTQLYFNGGNQINFGYATNGVYTGYINYSGYQNSDTQYRNLYVGDGRQGSILASFIGATGNVGIGTTNPQNKLHVAGSITIDGNINAKYQDIAEWVESSEQLDAGTVVVLDSTKSNQVISSSQSYDTRVAGVISEQPGITLGEKGESKVLVATTGRVKMKVDASKGPIHIGDLLVTSDIPGVAMKSEEVNLGGVQFHRPGTLIGKALEPLEKGKGEILVLLSLQ